jgi:hypothetical protein
MLKDRLLELIKMEGLNNNQFYKKTGLGIGFLDKVGEKLKRPSIEKISATFPHWNIDYLQNGEGEMLKENTRPDTVMVTETAESVTIPKSVLAILEVQARAIESQQRTIENLSLLGKQGTADNVATARASG